MYLAEPPGLHFAPDRRRTDYRWRDACLGRAPRVPPAQAPTAAFADGSSAASDGSTEKHRLCTTLVLRSTVVKRLERLAACLDLTAGPTAGPVRERHCWAY